MNTVAQPPDLASVEAWSYLEKSDGRIDESVICSWCGRFTVVRYGDGFHMAFRRYPREMRRMADAIGGAWDVATAVDNCVRYAEQEGKA